MSTGHSVEKRVGVVQAAWSASAESPEPVAEWWVVLPAAVWWVIQSAARMQVHSFPATPVPAEQFAALTAVLFLLLATILSPPVYFLRKV